jgi:two-component system, LuxR family, response regulator FixJ
VPEREPIIAVVDDDVSMLRALRRLLRSVGITVVTYTSVEEFLQSGLRGRIRCLVLDVMMPRMSGLDLLARLDASAVILLVIINTINTACADEQTRLRAEQAGVVASLRKPFEEEALLEAIRRALASDSGH